ncbi:MAG: glycosyltransferase family 2 protein [Pseudohongiella sp.]|nr:glycosyltransferase family 2 protein [Pseudohongiella sp.]
MSPSNGIPQLTVSVVVYHLDLPVLRQCLQSLLLSVQYAASQHKLSRLDLHVVDNGDNADALRSLLTELELDDATVKSVAHLYLAQGNIGFGNAHNLVIHQSAEQLETPADNDLYLILNPDVFLEQNTLAEGIDWLSQHAESVAVAPSIKDGNGGTASACKRYPSVLDFLLRGFAPAPLKKLFRRRLSRYDMEDLPRDRPTPDIPVISGCFMLFRHIALMQLQGFDPRYFLYFEDFDLAIRAHRLGTVTYLPSMVITHLGGNSARKGLRHIGMFVRSGVYFFSTHGWRWT